MSSFSTKNEWFALTGLREDGRKAEEVRTVVVDRESLDSADGSAWVKMGHTSVSAKCFGPQEALRRSEERVEETSFTVQVLTSPFAYGSSRRNATSSGREKEDEELASLIETTMKSVIMLDMYPRTVLKLVVSILCDDGAKLACSFNAVTFALLDAGIFLKDLPVTATVAITASSNGHIIFDPNRREERDGAALLHLAIPAHSKEKEVIFTHLDTGGSMALNPTDLYNIMNKGVLAASMTAAFFVDIYKQATLRSLYLRDVTAALTTSQFSSDTFGTTNTSDDALLIEATKTNESHPIDESFVNALVDRALTDPDLLFAAQTDTQTRKNFPNSNDTSPDHDKKLLLLSKYVQRHYGIGAGALLQQQPHYHASSRQHQQNVNSMIDEKIRNSQSCQQQRDGASQQLGL